MARRSESNPLDTAEERQLRALYLARAPEQIETDQAWAAVAPRLALQSTSARQRRGLGLWPTSASGRRFDWRTRLGIAAALVALPVMLMGVGLVKENLMPIDPGMQRIADEGLYQYVNQSQTVDGVTITVTAAYADEGRTVFYYHVRLSPQLARYNQSAAIGAWNLTAEQAATQANAPTGDGGLGVCAPWDNATRSASCYMVQGPFTSGATATHITLTLDISRVYLMPTGAGSTEINGQWRYQFTIPFHHMNVGSVEQFFPHLLHLAPVRPQP
jgi:hypothetical protein